MSHAVSSLITRITTLKKEVKTIIKDLDSQTEEELEVSSLRLLEINKEQFELQKVLLEIVENVKFASDAIGEIEDKQENLNTKYGEFANISQKILGDKNETRNNNERQSQINNYYSDKYLEYSKLFRILFFTLLAMLIVIIINKQGFLTEKQYRVLLITILLLGGIFMLQKYADILSRSNVNFQEYNWKFRRNSAPSLE